MASGILLLLARILLAAMFLSSGYAALSDIAGTASYFAGLGLEPASLLAWAVGIFELVAGVLLVVGFQTRAAAARACRCSPWPRPFSAIMARAATTPWPPSCTARRC